MSPAVSGAPGPRYGWSPRCPFGRGDLRHDTGCRLSGWGPVTSGTGHKRKLFWLSGCSADSKRFSETDSFTVSLGVPISAFVLKGLSRKLPETPRSRFLPGKAACVRASGGWAQTLHSSFVWEIFFSFPRDSTHFIPCQELSPYRHWREN